jgi:phosphatidylserine/phosphatidylglycerophosphate/cardiolipin synthase-like enzyme
MSLNRFNSFAPLRYASSGKFFVDGFDYFEALFSALDSAASSILMMGWMISPEFLLKR